MIASGLGDSEQGFLPLPLEHLDMQREGRPGLCDTADRKVCDAQMRI